jgi:2-keto-3-deoxy-L-rhamnonate aldolase RhmA
MPATVRNVAREKLEQGQLSLGVGVRMTRSVEIAKAMAVAGFDWLFLDMPAHFPSDVRRRARVRAGGQYSGSAVGAHLKLTSASTTV